VGHLGLFRFDFEDRSVELDNVVRGSEGTAVGVMTDSVNTLIEWGFASLGMETIFLRVLSDNTRAIQLYTRCGFRESMRVPLARVEVGDVIRWEEVDGTYRKPVSRYFVTLYRPRAHAANLAV
jgi:RimJ/RimL family protein N-acetyltransferase